MRIGLISDTHVPTGRRAESTGLWPQVYEALDGVDLILHGGDLYDPAVLDWLGEVAPVLAVSGNGDYGGWQRSIPPSDPRLKESRVLTLDGEEMGGDELRIGLVHDLPLPEAPPLRTLEGLMDHFFGGPVDVIVRGSTHAAEIATIRGVLIVNPGSPTYPNHQSLRLGTVGYLDIEGGRVQPSIVQLE